MNFIILFELVPFGLRTRPPDGTDVDHACSKFHKVATFHWQFDFRQVAQDIVDERL